MCPFFWQLLDTLDSGLSSAVAGPFIISDLQALYRIGFGFSFCVDTSYYSSYTCLCYDGMAGLRLRYFYVFTYLMSE